MAKKSSTTKETKGEQETTASEAREPEVTEPQAEQGPSHQSVMGLKKFDFSRPTPSADQEERRGIPFKQSYEDLRDSLSHTEARIAWRDGDRQKLYVREQMQAIHDDANLSDEGKREKAQQLLDANAPQISQTYEDARSKLESAAQSSYLFSIPFPDNKTLATTSVSDSTEMIAIQNEADALAQRVEGKSLQSITREKDPRGKGIRSTSNHTRKELQAEFADAMHTGGVEGRIKAFAIKRLCEAKGVSLDDVVDSHRRQSHRNAYRDAEVFERAYSMVPSSATLGRGLDTNPYDSRHGRRGAKGVGAYASSNKAISGSGKRQLFAKKNRKPPWK
jgi:hypothetical protein